MAYVTSEGARLIAAFLAAQKSVDMARSALNRAECDRDNSERALAKWLMPSDMKPGR